MKAWPIGPLPRRLSASRPSCARFTARRLSGDATTTGASPHTLRGRCSEQFIRSTIHGTTTGALFERALCFERDQPVAAGASKAARRTLDGDWIEGLGGARSSLRSYARYAARTAVMRRAPSVAQRGDEGAATAPVVVAAGRWVAVQALHDDTSFACGIDERIGSCPSLRNGALHARERLTELGRDRRAEPARGSSAKSSIAFSVFDARDNVFGRLAGVRVNPLGDHRFPAAASATVSPVRKLSRSFAQRASA